MQLRNILRLRGPATGAALLVTAALLVLGIHAAITAAAPARAQSAATPANSLPPTWTPSAPPPSLTPLVVGTPAPSFTPSRPTVTPTPTPASGVREANGLPARAIVTEDDLNDTLSRAYRDADDPPFDTRPVIALRYAARVALTMAFHNDFLDQSTDVIAKGTLAVRGDRIVFDETRADRITVGALIADETVWAGQDFILAAINDRVQELIDAAAFEEPPTWTRVMVYPDYLVVELATPEPGD